MNKHIYSYNTIATVATTITTTTMMTITSMTINMLACHYGMFLKHKTGYSMNQKSLVSWSRQEKEGKRVNISSSIKFLWNSMPLKNSTFMLRLSKILSICYYLWKVVRIQDSLQTLKEQGKEEKIGKCYLYHWSRCHKQFIPLKTCAYCGCLQALSPLVYHLFASRKGKILV